MSTATKPASKTQIPADYVILSSEDFYIDEELNNRENRDPERIEALATQIRSTGGLLNPITLYETPPEHRTEHDKDYELNSGYNRMEALKLLAEQDGDNYWIENIPCHVKAHTSFAQRHVDQLIENLGRTDLSPMETALAFKKAIDDPRAHLTVTTLAQQLAIPVPTVSNYMKVANNLCPELQKLVLDDEITFSNAKEIVAVKPALSREQQVLLIPMAKTKTPADFAKYLQATYKQAGEGEAGEGEAGEGEATETPASSQQRIHTSIRAKVLQDKYLPKLKQELDNAKGKDKDILAARIDTIQFVLNQEGTKLGAYLKPWEEELEEADRAKAQLHAIQNAEDKFIRVSIRAAEAMIREGAKAAMAGGKPVTLSEAIAAVKKTVEEAIKKGKDLKLPEHAAFVETTGEGEEQKHVYFLVEKIDSFMEEFTKKYNEHQKEKEAARIAREKAKAEAEKKAKAEAEEKAAEEANAAAEAGE